MFLVIQLLNRSIHLLGWRSQFNNKDAISKGIRDMVYRTNYVMSKFGCCDALIRSHMFNTYCTSYYGCPLWDLRNGHVNRFYTNWRKCVRKIWRVPWMTHGRILRHLVVGQSIQTQLPNRFLTFYFGVVHCENIYVNMCGSLCRYSNTNAASNLRLLLSALNNNGDCLTDSSFSSLRIKLYDKYECTGECSAVDQCVQDLCVMYEGYYHPIFDNSNLTNIIVERYVN